MPLLVHGSMRIATVKQSCFIELPMPLLVHGSMRIATVKQSCGVDINCTENNNN